MGAFLVDDVNRNADFSVLLQAWRDGDASVERRLLDQMYPLLKSMAYAQIRRQGLQVTMRPTELSHEAFVRLCGNKAQPRQNRAQFYAFAASMLRNILVDYLRERSAQKRGGVQGAQNVISLDDPEALALSDQQETMDWLAVDQAMLSLVQVDAESARVLELRIFGGLSNEEVADVCSISTATATRRWRFARSWLHEHLSDQQSS
jgi:RNA polymerase sigma factor (TIGR02999 family)